MDDKIKTVLIDDEPNALEVLKKLIVNYCPELKIYGTGHNLKTGKAAIEQHKPDLVFLDIEMPLGSGFDLLKSLPNRDFHVIFTTAYDQYALKAIKEQALDYILKPIDIDDLTAAVEKVKKFMEAPSAGDSDIAIHFEDKMKMIAIPTIYGYKVIKESDIIAVRADGSYCEVSLKGVHNVVISKNMKSVEAAVDPKNFMRVHRSYIVNLNEISEFHRGDGGYVVMSNGDRVEVGITNRNAIQERLQDRMRYL
jgi:two-component system LytT family response regulator